MRAAAHPRLAGPAGEGISSNHITTPESSEGAETGLDAYARKPTPTKCRGPVYRASWNEEHMNITEPRVITFDEIEGALQLREYSYRRPTRARRLISQCPACLAAGRTEQKKSLLVQSQDGVIYVRCDNGCTPDDILVDHLHLDGVLAARRPPGDYTEKHGSQLRVSYEFAKMFGDKLKHAHGLGWLYWTGRYWKQDAGDKRARQHVLRTLSRLLSDALGDDDLRKAVSRCETANGIDGVLRIAAALPEFRIDADQLDADPHLLNCANGTFDLRDFELRRHNSHDLLTQITEASYQENAAGPIWQRFLDEVLPDQEVQEYLRRVVGLALIGRVEQHILPILTGVGRNGKSTFIEALLFALGTYAMTADPHLFTAGQTSSVGQVDLMGRRVAVVSETDKGAKMAEETVKRLTGGDRIKARKLYQDWVEFDPSHTAFMVTNHPPQVDGGDDDALWARLRVIKFDVVVPPEKRDAELPDKLKVEAEAILAWAVEGLSDYQVGGLAEPEQVLVATGDYRRKSDHVGRFIDDCCTTAPTLKIKADKLFEAWQRWAAGEGCEAIGRSSFYEAVGCRPGTSIVRSNGARWIQGITLDQNIVE